MIRGEIWTASGGKDYAGKPRPVLVVQSDRFGPLESVTVCPFTTDSTDAPLIRLPVPPERTNGLKVASRIMVDKMTTVPRHKLGRRVGRLAEEEMTRVSRAIVVFLGLAD
jgi:mRNA interferase MazF